MSSNNVLKGAILVGLGAASYGMLATFVKLAYADIGITGQPFTPTEVISAQFLLGIGMMALINLWRRLQKQKKVIIPTKKELIALIMAGTSTGLTSIFYYLSVQYIPVSIAIVLLMQTVWMAILLEIFLQKKLPNAKKMIALILVLAGTLLATNSIGKTQLDWRGLLLGLLSAASFTTTMFTANRIALGVSAAQRSLFMLIGGAIPVVIFAWMQLPFTFNYDILWKWGILLALFGTVLPPLLLNAGFPHTGIGIGSIVAAIELPISVCMAFLLLGEKVIWIQWIGIALILGAIALLHFPLKK